MISREILNKIEYKHDAILVGISPFNMKDNRPLRLHKSLEGKYTIRVSGASIYETYEQSVAITEFNKYYNANKNSKRWINVSYSRRSRR